MRVLTVLEAFYDALEQVEDIRLFEHVDAGHRADPKVPNLLGNATRIVDLSPQVGTEIEGVQLSQLSEAGLDELALYAAKRGALVFRKQYFCAIGFEAQKKFVRHFGPLHNHGWAPHPAAGSEEHMIIDDHKESVSTATFDPYSRCACIAWAVRIQACFLQTRENPDRLSIRS